MPKSKYTEQIAKLLKIKSGNNQDLKNIQEQIKILQENEKKLVEEEKAAKKKKEEVNPNYVKQVKGSNAYIRGLLNEYLVNHGETADEVYNYIYEAYKETIKKCEEDNLLYPQEKYKVTSDMQITGLMDAEINGLKLKLKEDEKILDRDQLNATLDQKKDSYAFSIAKIAYLSKLSNEWKDADSPEWKQDIINEIYSDNLNENVKNFIEKDPLGKHIYEYSKTKLNADLMNSHLENLDLNEEQMQKAKMQSKAGVYFPGFIVKTIAEATHDYAEQRYFEGYFDYDKPNLSREEKDKIAEIADDMQECHDLISNLDSNYTEGFENDFIFDAKDIRIRGKVYGDYQPVGFLDDAKIAEQKRPAEYKAYKKRIEEITKTQKAVDEKLQAHEKTQNLPPEELRNLLRQTSDIKDEIEKTNKLINEKYKDLEEDYLKKSDNGRLSIDEVEKAAEKNDQQIENEAKKFNDIMKLDNSLENIEKKKAAIAEQRKKEIQRRKESDKYEKITYGDNEERYERKAEIVDFMGGMMKLGTALTEKKISDVEYITNLNTLNANIAIGNKYNAKTQRKRKERTNLKEAGKEYTAYLEGVIKGKDPEIPSFLKPKNQQAPVKEENQNEIKEENINEIKEEIKNEKKEEKPENKSEVNDEKGNPENKNEVDQVNINKVNEAEMEGDELYKKANELFNDDPKKTNEEIKTSKNDELNNSKLSDDTNVKLEDPDRKPVVNNSSKRNKMPSLKDYEDYLYALKSTAGNARGILHDSQEYKDFYSAIDDVAKAVRNTKKAIKKGNIVNEDTMFDEIKESIKSLKECAIKYEDYKMKDHTSNPKYDSKKQKLNSDDKRKLKIMEDVLSDKNRFFRMVDPEVPVSDNRFLLNTDRALARLKDPKNFNMYSKNKSKYIKDSAYAVFGQMHRLSNFGHPVNEATGEVASLQEFMDAKIASGEFKQSLLTKDNKRYINPTEVANMAENPEKMKTIIKSYCKENLKNEKTDEIIRKSTLGSNNSEMNKEAQKKNQLNK